MQTEKLSGQYHLLQKKQAKINAGLKLLISYNHHKENTTVLNQRHNLPQQGNL
jgi:hypothetical protein